MRLDARNVAALWRYLSMRRQGVVAPLFFVDRGAAVYIDPAAAVRIGRRVQIMRDLSLGVWGELRIGDDVFINRGVTVVARSLVVIGSGSLIGEGVSIHDDNHVVTPGVALRDSGFTTAAVVLGSQVWVGAKATILPGVTIGDGAVVAANAVVTRDVASGVTVGGVPARPLVGRSAEKQETAGGSPP